MPDSGVDLGLDLFELYRAGSRSLPEAAAQYAAAAGKVAAAAVDAEPAFRRHERFGGACGPAYPEWIELRATIETFLKETGENLRDTGQALVMAAHEYAAADRVASEELDRLKKQHGMA